jgi:TRAP transporter T-component
MTGILTMSPFKSLTGMIIVAFSLNGCSSLISSATEEFGTHLSTVILNHNDPDTVLSAIPSYLLLQETLLKQQPDNHNLLLSTAKLYGSYASLLNNEARLAPLSEKALAFSFRAACLQKIEFCTLQSIPYPEFEKVIQNSQPEDLASLYSLGENWALWIQGHKSDWNAIAQLAQVKAIMQHIIQVDEHYENGSAHLYLGVMSSLLPTAMGGNAPDAKLHFEKAIALSEGKNLMASVMYAKYYARMTFNRTLHDKVLSDVLKQSPQHENLTLINSIAQQHAKHLLKSADTIF